jgi:GNAT superfamily N-acetyltransferase
MITLIDRDLVRSAVPALDQIKTCTLEDFLGGDDNKVIIDDIFATGLDSVLADFLIDTGRAALPELASLTVLATLETDGDVVFTVAQANEDWDHGVLAWSRTTGQVIGAYTGCSLAVGRDLQTRGIGRALVMLRYLRDRDLPLWEHDKPGYSRAGYATHVSALEALRAMS